jgi:hypothetical protein
MRARCTNDVRSISRLENEAVLDRMWFRNGATLIVYAALIVTLIEWRLLGFN